MRQYFLAFVLVLISASVSAHAQETIDCEKLAKEPDYKPQELEAPMRFFLPERYACLGNAVNNPYLAVGTITKDTPAAFAEFAKSNRPDTPIEFASPGGNLIAALKLGDMLRAGRYDTSLGKLCASACAYAILGGVNRYIANTNFDADFDYDNRNLGATGTKFGVHQFYKGGALDAPDKKEFSAIDQSSVQMLTGVLLEYTLRMGVDERLVSAALGIAPWQEIRWLTQDEMIIWKVDNTKRVYSDLTFHAFGKVGSYVEVRSIKGQFESSLRMFCKTDIGEPLFTFVTDQPMTTDANSTKELQVARAVNEVKESLQELKIEIALGSEKRTSVFQLQDIQGLLQNEGTVRVYAAVKTNSLNRRDAERLTRISLIDNGNLPRSRWTFQDFVKFRIVGDKRLVRLAMNNCAN